MNLITNQAKVNRIRKLIQSQGGKCSICCEHLVFEDATFDHVVPRYHGGTNADGNLAAAHRLCNWAKGSNADYIPEFASYVAAEGPTLDALRVQPETIPTLAAMTGTDESFVYQVLRRLKILGQVTASKPAWAENNDPIFWVWRLSGSG